MSPAERQHQILERLGSGNPDTVLDGVELAIGFQYEQELVGALAPNAPGDARHYNAGRAAAVADCKQFLADLRSRRDRQRPGS